MAIVLVVEDEDQVLVLAESYLQERGYETLSATTADGALAILESEQSIDLLFTDLGLYDEINAGVELARRAKELRPELKILYTTGRSITDGLRALLVEDSAILEKPYTVEDLIAALDTLAT